MGDVNVTDIRRLALIVRPKDMGNFTIDVIAGLPSETDALGTSYYETTFTIAKSAIEGEEGIDALFEVAKEAMKELMAGKVVLSEQ